jgi:hypothetical protein
LVRQTAPMTPLFEAALEIQNIFIRQQWHFCIIGGIAVLRWGEPRFTRDVDVTLLTGFGREDEFILPILSSEHREHSGCRRVRPQKPCTADRVAARRPNRYCPGRTAVRGVAGRTSPFDEFCIMVSGRGARTRACRIDTRVDARLTVEDSPPLGRTEGAAGDLERLVEAASSVTTRRLLFRCILILGVRRRP